MKKILCAFVAFISFVDAFSQGIIRGKVTDNTGEAVIGAIVRIKTNQSSAVTTDLDGNYSIKVIDTNPQILVVSYVGYNTQEISVSPKNNEVILKDVVLSSSAILEEVVVTTKATKANNYYMENLKMKSSSTMDYISQETMKKTGDVNVVNAVARVSGVSSSSQSGFITVRGIGDRYVSTTINGMRIPTLDPFTNNIRLDLFPASLVDNIILTKTTSPDIQGNWAGAYLSIETKEYPDKLSVNVETSVGFIPQSSFKSVISSQQSSTDWLGFDTGLREHSNNPYGPNPIVIETPNQYQTMTGLGLGNYYNSIGVTSSTPWSSTYFNLGLVQLGLLQNSQLGDPNAIAQATNQFNNGPYKGESFANMNATAIKNNQSFKDNWNVTTKSALPNFTQSFSIGNQINLFGKPLGFLVGLRYNTTTQYDPNSVWQRVTYVRSLSQNNQQKINNETYAWSGLVNLAYKYHANHSIGLLFMPNYTGSNQTRYSLDNTDSTAVLGTISQYYEQRRQLIWQLKSEHYIPKPQLRVELNASYTDGKSSVPDYRDFSYITDATRSYYIIDRTVGDGVHRYFRYLTDNLFDSKIACEIPVLKSDAGIRKLKFGGSYQYNYRRNDQYDYNFFVTKYPTSTLPTLTSDAQINNFFSLNNFGIQNGGINYWYSESGLPINHTIGYSNLAAAYIMAEFAIIKPLKLAGGVRMEKSYVYTDALKYDSLHYAVNDPRRVGGRQGDSLFNPGKLNTLNFLPSISVIYHLNKDEDAPMNLRANFSQTVARPSMRELSNMTVYDNILRYNVVGNPGLKQVQVLNYDLRYEWYFKNRDFLSVGGFYKDFKNHIELVNQNGSVTWRNIDKSYVTGIELEGRKNIVKRLDLMVNATFVSSKSSSILYGNHPMYGQAPFIINAILSYNLEKYGLTATLSYNIQGKRLSLLSDNPAIPNIYEMPRNQFDFKVMEKLGKYFTLSFTMRDLLNTAIRRVYLYDDGKKIDYDRYRYGAQYVISVAYKI